MKTIISVDYAVAGSSLDLSVVKWFETHRAADAYVAVHGGEVIRNVEYASGDKLRTNLSTGESKVF